MTGFYDWLKTHKRTKDKAARIFMSLVAKHYSDGLLTIKPSDNLNGLLDQIDNATAPLVRPQFAGARLTDISKKGRTLTLTFCNSNGSIWTIEAYGTLADDVAGWRRNAGLDR